MKRYKLFEEEEDMICPIFGNFVYKDCELDKEGLADYFKMAEQAKKDGDLKKFAWIYEHCAEICPGCSELYFLVGKAQVEARRFSKAPQYFNATLRFNPGKVDWYYQVGECYWNAGRTDTALICFYKFLEKKPGDRDDYFKLGEKCSEVGKYKKAVDFYTKSIQMGKEDAAIYFCRGYAYVERNKFKLALADFDKVTEIDPTYPKVNFEKGFCFYRLGEYEKGIVELTEAINVDKNDGNVYLKRAHCFESLKRFHEAVADYTIALNLLSGIGYYSSISACRGGCYIELGEWEKAIADFDNAICLGKKEGQPFVISDFEMRGLAYEKSGNKERAEEDYQVAHSLRVDFSEPYFDYEKKTLIFKKHD